MKLFVIDRILKEHGFEYIYQDGQIAALGMYSGTGIKGEWILIDESWNRAMIYEWLGY